MKIVRPLTIASTGSFTRATVGTYFDRLGALQTAAINVARFSFNPASLASGPVLLLEPAATNILLGSATLATQSVTVTATPYILSFYGLGNITLSGAATGTITGSSTTGVRTTLAFTPTAGTLTLTVSGPCTLAQLETGTRATSYIATTVSSVTRSADVSTLMLVTNVPENDYAVWNAGTTYGVGDRILDLTAHKIYESSVAGNLNHAPPNTSYWIDAGASNRWRMFDQSVTSQTSQATNIIVAITPSARIDSIIGLNVQATTATINVVDPTDGLVYNKKIALTSYSGITDWYAYFYEPIVNLADFIASDLLVSYPSATVTVCLSSDTASIGALVVGLSKELGLTEAGARTGIVDYSVKTKDSFGNYFITPRAFSKRADFTIKVNTSSVDDIQNLLASYRTVPIVYIGSNTSASQQYASTIIYGYYKDFSIDVTYPPLSTLSIQVEGLT